MDRVRLKVLFGRDGRAIGLNGMEPNLIYVDKGPDGKERERKILSYLYTRKFTLPADIDVRGYGEGDLASIEAGLRRRQAVEYNRRNDEAEEIDAAPGGEEAADGERDGEPQPVPGV